ncbi:MAG: Ig-like domain-containing protein, partial [Perlucidibaca sp.]
MRASSLVVLLAGVLSACGGGSSGNHQKPVLPDYPASACATFNTRGLVYAYPAPGQTEVVPAAPVVLRFTHPLANTSPVSAASLFTITNETTGASVPFTASVVDGGRSVMLQPTAVL